MELHRCKNEILLHPEFCLHQRFLGGLIRNSDTAVQEEAPRDGDTLAAMLDIVLVVPLRPLQPRPTHQRALLTSTEATLDCDENPRSVA